MVGKKCILRITLAAGFLLTAFIIGCATVPGKTGTDQVQTIDDLIGKTLLDLERMDPKNKEAIAQSVGYVIMNNKITKIPAVGAGAGYGVAVDNKTGKKTYLRMTRFDVGAGWGARSVRPVLIFHDEKKFHDFIDGMIDINIGAEASAKVGESGAAGGLGSKDKKDEKTGYSATLITDAGVSATWSVGVIRVAPIELKKQE